MCLFNANPTSKHYINTSGDVNFAEILKKNRRTFIRFRRILVSDIFHPIEIQCLKKCQSKSKCRKFGCSLETLAENEGAAKETSQQQQQEQQQQHTRSIHS